MQYFRVVRSASLAEGTVLSHSYTPPSLLTSTPFPDGKGQSRGNNRGNSNFAWLTNPSQMVMLKITRNSNVELYRPSEKNR